MDTILAWAQAYKRGWTKDKFFQGNFRNEDKTQFCFLGYGMTLPTWGMENVLGQQAFISEVEKILRYRGFNDCQTIIANVNDGEKGYETLMDVVDEIIAEHMPKSRIDTENDLCKTYYEARELVYA